LIALIAQHAYYNAIPAVWQGIFAHFPIYLQSWVDAVGGLREAD